MKKYPPDYNCQPQDWPHMDGKKLAQAYIPWQRFNQCFSPSEALDRGTLFPELYRPYQEKRR